MCLEQGAIARICEVLCTVLVLRHPSDAKYFDVAHKFLKFRTAVPKISADFIVNCSRLSKAF